MTSTDMVVVIPGILGSTLARNDKLVWAPSMGAVLRAIATFGRSIRELQLPDGIGDANPDDGVQPVTIMPDLHLLPGIWTPVTGYDVLVKRLTSRGFRPCSQDPQSPPGNLLLYPYDWRLSNRYNGDRLKTVLDPALERWRAQGGQFADAKICFVCHSMGGLVARWYLKQGGIDQTSKLITLGTPYRGAAKSLGQLIDRTVRVGMNLTEFARSMPSAYQLLPSYACVEQGPNLVCLDDLGTLPGLDTRRVGDAMAFAHQLESAEAGDANFEAMRHAITGIEQTTMSTVRINGDKVTVLDTYQGKNLGGDGTVPAVAGPRGIALDSPAFKRVGDKHGSLQANKAVLDEVMGVIFAEDIVPMATSEPIPDVIVPELITAGADLPIEVRLESGDGIRVTVIDEAGRQVDTRIPRSSEGVFRTIIPDLAPGAYAVEVTVAGGAAPVCSRTLVWSDDAVAQWGWPPG